MKKLILILILTAACAGLGAEQRDGKAAFELKKHEFSLSGAFLPGRYAFGYEYNNAEYFNHVYGADNLWNISRLYETSASYMQECISGSWTLSYNYNFNKYLALTSSFSYEGGWLKTFDRATDVELSREANHFLTPLVGLRVSWFNRSFVRMYSSVAGGVSCRISSSPALVFAGQLVPIGISFGKSLYGFAELGVGTVFLGGQAGIAYRF